MQLSSKEFLQLCFAVIGGLTIGWGVFIFLLSKKTEEFKSLFSDGLMLRMLAVIFIITATALLGIAEKLSAEASAILAGVAGYVLGGVRTDKPGKNAEEGSETE